MTLIQQHWCRALQRAICDSFQVTVHVVTSEADNWYLKYEPCRPQGPGPSPEGEGAGPPSAEAEQGSEGGPEIFLTYIAPIHYNAIR
jgi:hypothetical protein